MGIDSDGPYILQEKLLNVVHEQGCYVISMYMTQTARSVYEKASCIMPTWEEQCLLGGMIKSGSSNNKKGGSPRTPKPSQFLSDQSTQDA